ncbi:MAG: IspD/TarI family cytidylyltransferase [Candidatus Omnitrophota bacterium]
MKKNLALILAGGNGSRISHRISHRLPKQFLELGGKTILQHTIDKFEAHPAIDAIFLVMNPAYIPQTLPLVRDSGYQKMEKILPGGATRQESSRIGVFAADPDVYENILIHDAARPFISRPLITRILETLVHYSAVNTATPSTDTIFEIDADHTIRRIPDRTSLRCAQTPQSFKLPLIRQAHQLAIDHHLTDSSDDCTLICRFNLSPVYVLDGDPSNMKITYTSDLHAAEKILETFIYER